MKHILIILFCLWLFGEFMIFLSKQTEKRSEEIGEISIKLINEGKTYQEVKDILEEKWCKKPLIERLFNKVSID